MINILNFFIDGFSLKTESIKIIIFILITSLLLLGGFLESLFGIKIIYIITILIYILYTGIFIANIFLIRKKYYFLKNSERLNAKVVGFNQKKTYNYILCPIIEFLYKENLYSFTADFCEKSFNQSYLIGEEIKIRINPLNPNEIYIEGFYNYWFKHIFIILMYFGILYLGYLLIN